MKSAAVILLLVAIIAGVFSVANFADAVERRNEPYQREDFFVFLFAGVSLAASMAAFSQAKRYAIAQKPVANAKEIAAKL